MRRISTAIDLKFNQELLFHIVVGVNLVEIVTHWIIIYLLNNHNFYTHLYIYIYMYMYICICIYIYIYIYMCVCVCVCV